MSTVYIGIDVGKTGSVVVLRGKKTPIVEDTPCVKVSNPNKKSKIKYKRVYDIQGMVSLLSPYAQDNVVVLIEAVHTQPGEGNVSAFDFGRGLGLWQGIGAAFCYTIVMVSPMKWKNAYPELLKGNVRVLKQEQRDLRIRNKSLNPKKDKEEIKQNKSQIEKLSRQIKYAQKKRAREIASKKYPKLADVFSKVKDADRAEALLMALYLRDHENELVQSSL